MNKGRFLRLPVLLDTYFGKFTTSPAPANVGLQDDMDIILLVINNIGRGRKAKKNQRHCFGEVSQLIMTGRVHFSSCSLKIILGSCLRGRLLNGFFLFFCYRDSQKQTQTIDRSDLNDLNKNTALHRPVLSTCEVNDSLHSLLIWSFWY